PLACKYSKTPNTRGKLALVDEGGFVSLFDTLNARDSEGDEESLVPQARWRGHDNTIFDIEWSSDDARLLTASADETCRLWDVERQQVLGEFRGHSQTVRAVSWKHGDLNCFSTASRDGSIMMWDMRCNKAFADGIYSCRPVNAVSNAHYGLQRPGRVHRGKSNAVGGSVTGIQHLQQNANLVASVGSTSEMVKYWDIRISTPSRASALPTPVASSLRLSSAKRPRGTSSLTLDPDGTRIYTACNDSRVYVHNALSPGYPIAQLAAPEFECHSFNVGTSMSPCGQYLAAGSSNGSAVVWELDRYGFNSSKRRAVLQGHMKEAGCVAWYPGKERTQMVTCGDDGTMRVWDLDAQLAQEGRDDP
ncbi:WD40 repeat-like protein, partial [Martensiomyces pterosporus]